MREKIDLSGDWETIEEALGVSTERRKQITNHELCGLEKNHTIAEHLETMWNRDDVTDVEMMFVMYDLGVKVAVSEFEADPQLLLSLLMSKGQVKVLGVERVDDETDEILSEQTIH